MSRRYRAFKVNDVWHCKRTYRRVVEIYLNARGRITVLYENQRGTTRRCLRETFGRWMTENKVRRAQRHRKRALALS